MSSFTPEKLRVFGTNGCFALSKKLTKAVIPPSKYRSETRFSAARSSVTIIFNPAFRNANSRSLYSIVSKLNSTALKILEDG